MGEDRAELRTGTEHDGWEAGSPQLVKGPAGTWELHIPFMKEIARPEAVEEQVQDDATRICAADLNINEHLAVCVVLTPDGKLVATKFIGGGKELNARRKRQVGRIYRRMRATGLIRKGEHHSRRRWHRVTGMNENAAHLVSRRIVDFAVEHGATIIVFEDLRNFMPRKSDVDGRGKRRSAAANLKRSYWLRGKIQAYTEYKAKALGIVVRHVSPKDTSRLCSGCGSPVVRYNGDESCEHQEGYEPGAPLMYCPTCGKRDHADRNAAINIGKRLLARYRKAPASRLNRRGVGDAQEA